MKDLTKWLQYCMLCQGPLTWQLHCGPQSPRRHLPTHTCVHVHVSFLQKQSCFLVHIHSLKHSRQWHWTLWECHWTALREGAQVLLCTATNTIVQNCRHDFSVSADSADTSKRGSHHCLCALQSGILGVTSGQVGLPDSWSILCTATTLHVFILSLPHKLSAIT